MEHSRRTSRFSAWNILEQDKDKHKQGEEERGALTKEKKREVHLHTRDKDKDKDSDKDRQRQASRASLRGPHHTTGSHTTGSHRTRTDVKSTARPCCRRRVAGGQRASAQCKCNRMAAAAAYLAKLPRATTCLRGAWRQCNGRRAASSVAPTAPPVSGPFPEAEYAQLEDFVRCVHTRASQHRRRSNQPVVAVCHARGPRQDERPPCRDHWRWRQVRHHAASDAASAAADAGSDAHHRHALRCGAGKRADGRSTESGIPDYRSPNGAYTKGHKPTYFSEFMGSAKVRQRYWARSMEAWSTFSLVRPNATHTSLAQLEAEGCVHHLITQVCREACGRARCWPRRGVGASPLTQPSLAGSAPRAHGGTPERGPAPSRRG